MARVLQEPFGQCRGQDITRYTLQGNNVTVKIINFGGIINEIHVPDRNGKTADICLGFDNVEGYGADNSFQGALVGRVANRIAKGKFTLDGQEYSLFINNGPNSLHGGKEGYYKRVWASSVEGSKVVLKYVSPDGEENYPGELTVVVTYELTADGELVLDYTAITTKATPVNLTNHCYYNLAGQGSGPIYDHVVTLHSDFYTVIDDTLIPTGEIKSVEGTLMDLRTPVRLGDRLHAVNGGKGYDNNFNLRWTEGKFEKKLAARMEHPASGRFLEMSTTEPGIQFYTGYFLEARGVRGKGDKAYGKFSGICMEAQHYPDSVNHTNFPNTILRPGETYRQITSYKFGAIP